MTRSTAARAEPAPLKLPVPESTQVSCVVVAYHRPEPLARLLTALSDELVEIVVVNVDDDPTVASVADGQTVVPLLGNPGFAAAVNRGAEAAGSDTIVFMNDDVLLRAHDVLALASIVHAGRHVVVPKLVARDGTIEGTIACLPTPMGLAREWLLLPDRPVAALRGWMRVEKWRRPCQQERVEAACAAVVATRRSLVLEEPLCEEYFLYWEESDWFARLARRGAIVVYEPSVTAIHDGGRDDVRVEKSRLLARNAVRCVRRTQGRGAGFVAWVVVVAWNVRLVLTDGLGALAGGRQRRSRLPARLAGLWAALGSWRVLR